MIPIDDGPLRKRAATEYTRAMGKLEKARGELRSFEEEDRPAFGRWMAVTFGALLTELRENARLIAQRQDLFDEVQMEMMLGNHRNPGKAYGAVMKRRNSPREQDDIAAAADANTGGDGGDEEDDAFEEMGGEIPEADRAALFEDFLRSIAGVDPRQLDDEEYESMFEEFKEEMFGEGPEADQPQVPGRQKPAPVREEEGRIKEIYRSLVRRLHPDTRADGDATVSAIWHDVQQAYEARNLDRLETLLALTEMQNGANGSKASFFQMREALAEMGRALRAIQRSLAEAKRDPAWAFTRSPYHGPLEKRIRRELEESLDQQQWMLRDLERVIDEWSRSWEAPLRNPGKRHRPPDQPKAKRRRAGPDIPETVQTEFTAFW
jgi:hypothetical protein